MEVDFSELKGKTFVSVTRTKEESRYDTCTPWDRITLISTTGERYIMEHIPECCEEVYIESIVGDLDDLVGSEILLAEKVQQREEDGAQALVPYDVTRDNQTFTWTFYKLATLKGYVDIRWYGESNGYYSEDVSLRRYD